MAGQARQYKPRRQVAPSVPRRRLLWWQWLSPWPWSCSRSSASLAWTPNSVRALSSASPLPALPLPLGHSLGATPVPQSAPCWPWDGRGRRGRERCGCEPRTPAWFFFLCAEAGWGFPGRPLARRGAGSVGTKCREASQRPPGREVSPRLLRGPLAPRAQLERKAGRLAPRLSRGLRKGGDGPGGAARGASPPAG